jgi:hypothetical protein
MKLEQHIIRQMDFSANAFGPGPRFGGVCDHVRKELIEIKEDGDDPAEWVDVWLLTMDGLWRCLRTSFIEITDLELATMIVEMRDLTKQEIVNLCVAGADPYDQLGMELRVMTQDCQNRPQSWVRLNLWATMGLYRALRNEDLSRSIQFTKSLAEAMIEQKQIKNENRVWPDWRTQSPDQAIEHVKGIED